MLENSPKDALTEEFQLMMKSINLGKTKAEALREMKQRIDTIQINQFVETMVQSIEQGSAVVETLNTIAGALNSKRFQIAEEEAGKISIKMMIPLIIFILPAVMLILLGPMILEFIIVSR